MLLPSAVDRSTASIRHRMNCQSHFLTIDIIQRPVFLASRRENLILFIPKER
uniref:Uncharacterized protein n=1 Tax=Romanomermis culicivorax TaxID=13658 RepID=A0A915JNR0_ROMCU